MGINSIMTNALNTKRTLTDDFKFTFSAKGRKFSTPESGLSAQDIFDMSVISVNLPQVESSSQSIMQGGEYRVYNAVFRPFSLSVTFRDFGSMDIRNYFVTLWMDSQRGYFDDVVGTVTIHAGGKIVFHSAHCLLTSVGQVQFDNKSTQPAEFTIELTSPYYTDWQTTKFGSDQWRSKTESKTGIGLPGSPSDLISQGTDILGGLNSVVSKIGRVF